MELYNDYLMNAIMLYLHQKILVEIIKNLEIHKAKKSKKSNKKQKKAKKAAFFKPLFINLKKAAF